MFKFLYGNSKFYVFRNQNTLIFLKLKKKIKIPNQIAAQP